MPKDNFVLAFPKKNVSKLREIFSGYDSVRWLYLGKDYFARRQIEKEMGSRFSRIDISRLHDEVANNIRQEHVQWVDTLNRTYGANIEWWFGAISSRNVYNSNLFQYTCYLEILERLCIKDRNMPDLIIVESPGLVKAIQNWALRKNISVDIIFYYKAYQKAFISYMRSLSGWGSLLISILLRWIAAYISRKRYKVEKIGNRPFVIVDTFVHDYCLSDGGIFKDHYFPYLHEYLSKKGIQVIVHPVLYGFRFNYLSIYKRMRISSTNFIIQEDFLHLSDYILSLTYPLRELRRKIKAMPFRNFDLSDILKEEQMQQSFSSGMQSVLVCHLFLRLGETGIYPNQIIEWYENHVMDKALIAGARKAFPNTKIVGVQIFIHSPNFLNLFPCQSEVEAGISPDVLLETSKYQCNTAQSFTKDIPCKAAASLRYAHLFDRRNSLISVSEDDKKVIGILLPFDIDEAVELLKVLNEGLPVISKDVVFLIKGHPDYSPAEIVSAFGEKNWPACFEICRMTLSETLDKTSIVISSNSGSMVEAAARGIPVIFLGRQTVLNHNVLSRLRMEISAECFSAAELAIAIRKYLNLLQDKKCDYKEMGNIVRDLFFTPVNEETMSLFLDSYQQESAEGWRRYCFGR